MAGAVLLFGRLKDAFGAASIPLPAGVATAADLRARLIEINPDLAHLLAPAGARMAINQNLIADEGAAPVSSTDEIALLPPLSGG